MFRYNRFWHFWFRLDNRHYLRATVASIVVAAIALAIVAPFIPVLWVIPLISIAVILVSPLITAGIIALFTLISNVLYKKQNETLEKIKKESPDEALKEEIDLYLNRRAVCPQELLEGKHLNLAHKADEKTKDAVAKEPLIVETEDTLDINQKKEDPKVPRRNPSFKATGKTTELFIKEAAAKDALSEIAAREMAEILGFSGLIPSNTLTKTEKLPNGPLANAGRILSRQKISELIDKTNTEDQDKKIKNTPGVQNAVAKFVFNLKTAAYRTKAAKEEQLKLLYIQKFMPNALDGLEWFSEIFNEPVVQVLTFFGGLSTAEKKRQRDHAKKVVQRIDLPSFQDNFLLHLILGSQDANPGNTLFSEGANGKLVLSSIDHERIMPEDNYNVTKKIPMANGKNIVEKNVQNVFPIRMWLAGLPQADVPFTKEIIKKTLASLNPERLLAYHHQKKLFSSAAVGAQLERLLLIREVFETESKKTKITLTPKELFLKFIDNHPTYNLLKNEYQLSDLYVFALLGQVPEDADLSLWRHPLQYLPMRKAAQEAQANQLGAMLHGEPLFSEETFKSPYSHNLMFFNHVLTAQLSDKANKAGLDILAETAAQLNL